MSGPGGWVPPFDPQRLAAQAAGEQRMCGHGITPASSCGLCLSAGHIYAVGDRVIRMHPVTAGLQRGVVEAPKVAGASAIGRIPVRFDGQAEPEFVSTGALRPDVTPNLLPEGAVRLGPGERVQVIDVSEYLLVVTLETDGNVGVGGNGQLATALVPGLLRALADRFEQGLRDAAPGGKVGG